jgi:hypothetical protein
MDETYPTEGYQEILERIPPEEIAKFLLDDNGKEAKKIIGLMLGMGDPA